MDQVNGRQNSDMDYFREERFFKRFINGDYFREYAKKHDSFYGEADPSTIEECVGQALPEGKHFTFAKFYIEKCRHCSELFQEKIEGYIRERICTDNGEKFPEGRLPKLKLYHKQVWNGIETKTEDGENLYYQDDQIRNCCTNGKGVREVIIQLGICCRLTVQQLNELLNLMKYPGLYLLNLMDIPVACEIKNNCKTMEPLSCEKAQALLDDFYKRSRQDLQEFLEQHAETNSSFGTVGISNGKKKRETEKPVSRRPLDVAAEENKEQWKQYEDHINYGKSLTMYYSEKYESIETIKDFLDTEYAPIFGLGRYSLPENVEKYIKNKEQYEKNLYYSMTELWGKYNGKIMDGYDSGRVIFTSRMGNMGLVVAIMQYKNILQHRKPWGMPTFFSRTSVEQWLRGRVSNNNVKALDGTEEKATIYTPEYEFMNLLKFAVATGNENDLSFFMDSAGYKFHLADADESQGIERTLALVSYAVYYRDALIDRWCREDEMLDKSELGKRFPFIELLMNINRDIEAAIQTEYSECIDRYKRNQKMGGRINEVEALLSDLLYPVDDADIIW